MPYTYDTLTSELGKAVRKSVRMGYADGAGLYARMLARFVLQNTWTTDETDLDWFVRQGATRQRQVQSLVSAMTAAGRPAREALSIARQVLS